jgi:hypothetical protein
MARAGTVTVTTAGTSLRGPDQTAHEVYLRGHPNNTKEVYVGGADGEVSGTTGFPLPPTGPAICLIVSNLSALWFDANVSGEKVCWILVD